MQRFAEAGGDTRREENINDTQREWQRVKFFARLGGRADGAARRRAEVQQQQGKGCQRSMRKDREEIKQGSGLKW